MRIFVTGVEGYIGALLAPMLEARGHDVVGTDTGYYRDGWLYSDKSLKTFPRFVNKDLRRIVADDLKGFDAIVHLAELSNDPLGQNKPEITYQINHLGSLNLARNAKSAGVPRFVYTSSCSVYGVGSGDFLTEEAPVNPQTAYAHCKVNVERDVGALADDRFSPVFLRNATAYGASPRMRFDIVLNNLSGWAKTTGVIAMTSDGTPWRPLVHVLDICKAIVCSVEAPRDAVHNQIFNVGHDADNYRVREIAEITGGAFPGCKVTFGAPSPDNRSYRVSFAKISSRLPGFKCDWTAEKGARQLKEIYDRIGMDKAMFEFRPFTRLKQLKYLIETNQLDDEFYWRV
jgi:nucleoside-diphosphate-sugar epimerase